VTQAGRTTHWTEAALIGISTAALAAVLFGNVLRVKVSPEAAYAARAILFGASWIAAIGWAVKSQHKAALLWLGGLAACGALIAFCQAFAGDVSVSSLLQVIGPGGAGIGLALLIERRLREATAVSTAWITAAFGCIAAVWLALEPELELWKLLPNNWETSKNLEYRWGIRMGEERARFLFDTPMEAGVVQWFIGSICLASALSTVGAHMKARLLGVMSLLLFASVGLTYSRAGIVLGMMSLGLAVLMRVRTRRALLGVCLCAGLILPLTVILANHFNAWGSPALSNLTSIFDPSEEANQIRLRQFMEAGRDVSGTLWHGEGAATFVTFQEAPRMPEHESSPLGLVTAFGIGGAALVALFTWQFFRRRKLFTELVVNKACANRNASSIIVVLTVVPFAAYSLMAPVLAGIAFGMICFTTMGLLVTCDEP
jgi:hypothetical protein